MIARLEGATQEHFGGTPPPLGVRRIVVDVHGVGYLVTISAITAAALPSIRDCGGEVVLFVHTKVSDTAIQLFGFATVEEMRLFEILLTADGVGPATALALLAGIGNVADAARAVAEGDTAKLTKVNGIGKKTAEKLVADLADRLIREIEGGMF